MNLVSLQTKTKNSFQDNLDYLENLILQTPLKSFILAPELALTNYSYECINEASDFTNIAIKRLLGLSKERTISLTMIEKIDEKYFNTFFMFKDNEIQYKQSKVELFKLNNENKYFTKGNQEKIKLFDFGNLKVGILICFELRFLDYWQELQGADIILVPAMWGKNRKDNYETLCKSLAIINQCYVLASDSANEDCAKSSCIISPFGNKIFDDEKEIISSQIDLKEIKMMRKYLDVGIK